MANYTPFDPINAKKQAYVKAHLKDAQAIARELNVPAENILGLSALESDWGNGPFAKDGNNYFGMHYPAPFATGYRKAKNSDSLVATYSNLTDSYKSFMTKYRNLITGVDDPKEFASILQKQGKFGIGESGPMPSYTDNVRDTAEKLRPFIYGKKND